MVDARQNILNILEEKGIISSFKANLRTEVLKAMSKSLEKPEILVGLESNEAQICLELIYDFLKHFKLFNTLEIFYHEANMKKRQTINDVEYKTGIRSEPGKPLLFSILDKSKHSASFPEHSFDYPISKFPSKLGMKIPEIGLAGKKEIVPATKIEISKPEPAKAQEKPAEKTVEKPAEKPVEKPPNPLTTLPKPVDKGANMKLQPLLNPKKVTNFKSFDVLADEGKPIKRDFSSDSSIDEEIEEDFVEDHNNKDFYESQGTSSMGVDASVNSLVLDDFDHVENVRAPRRK